MIRKRFFMFCFLLAVMVLNASQGQCENWKKYFENNRGKYFYDKDSIHYPKQKKTLFGITVQNKEIVNVWVRWTSNKGGYTRLRQIYCAERLCKACDSGDYIDPWVMAIERYDKEPILPASEAEHLLKKVCP